MRCSRYVRFSNVSLLKYPLLEIQWLTRHKDIPATIMYKTNNPLLRCSRRIPCQAIRPYISWWRCTCVNYSDCPLVPWNWLFTQEHVAPCQCIPRISTVASSGERATGTSCWEQAGVNGSVPDFFMWAQELQSRNRVQYNYMFSLEFWCKKFWIRCRLRR